MARRNSFEELAVRRLTNVNGEEGKQNDVIVCPANTKIQGKQHIIFFGGDIQVHVTVVYIHLHFYILI